tara:strand:- start:125 stop:358 length:234 start_codon:yes stop_codon:yes gene_type:complete
MTLRRQGRRPVFASHRVPMAISLSPVIDCHTRSARQDARPGAAARVRAENWGWADNVEEREIASIIAGRGLGQISLF